MGYITLRKKNLFFNLKAIEKKCKSKEKIAVVLKDNAYGHGLVEIATMCKEFGITKAVVRNRNEAEKIKSLFKYILILNGTVQKDNFNYAINSILALKKSPSYCNIELKIDTGMHRNGISLQDIEKAVEIVFKKRLNLKGVFTHYRSAELLSSELFWQKKVFEEVKRRVKQLLKKYHLPLCYFHSCNSAALFRNFFDDDFARIGIAMYGYLEIDNFFKKPPLKPVLTLWGKKISQRVLKKGSRIGYGGNFEAPKNMIVSTYDVGYADGIFRSDGNKEFFLNSKNKVLGKISMDNISINSKKDKIPIIKDATIWAKQFNTITYEILSKLSPSLPRIVNI